MKTWRDKVDPSIKDHLEVQIAEAAKHVNAYRDAPNSRNAQLWCALANLSKQISELNIRINYLENAIKEKTPRSQEEKDIMKKVMGVEKVIDKTKPTKRGKALKKTLKKY